MYAVAAQTVLVILGGMVERVLLPLGFEELRKIGIGGQVDFGPRIGMSYKTHRDKQSGSMRWVVY